MVLPVKEMLKVFSTYQTGKSFLGTESVTFRLMSPDIKSCAGHFMALAVTMHHSRRYV